MFADASSDPAPIVPNYDPARNRWTFVVDTASCIGCGLCVVACKEENHVTESPEFSRTWVERHATAADGTVYVDSPGGGADGFPSTSTAAGAAGVTIESAFFEPRLCMQCEDSPCTSVCPVGATYRTAEGIVLVDASRCIGCGYCVLACPYGARYIAPAARSGAERDARRRRQVHLVLPPHQPRRPAGLRRGLPGRGEEVRRRERPFQRGRDAHPRAQRRSRSIPSTARGRGSGTSDPPRRRPDRWTPLPALIALGRRSIPLDPRAARDAARAEWRSMPRGLQRWILGLLFIIGLAVAGRAPRPAARLGSPRHPPDVRVGPPHRRLRLLRDHDQRALPGVVAGHGLRHRALPAAREAPRDPGPAEPDDGVRDHRPRPPLPDPDGVRGGARSVALVADVVDGRLLRRLPVLPPGRGLEHVLRPPEDPPGRLRGLVVHGDRRSGDARRRLRRHRGPAVLARAVHADPHGRLGVPCGDGPAGRRLLRRPALRAAGRAAGRGPGDPGHPSPPGHGSRGRGDPRCPGADRRPPGWLGQPRDRHGGPRVRAAGRAVLGAPRDPRAGRPVAPRDHPGRSHAVAARSWPPGSP